MGLRDIIESRFVQGLAAITTIIVGWLALTGQIQLNDYFSFETDSDPNTPRISRRINSLQVSAIPTTYFSRTEEESEDDCERVCLDDRVCETWLFYPLIERYGKYDFYSITAYEQAEELLSQQCFLWSENWRALKPKITGNTNTQFKQGVLGHVN